MDDTLASLLLLLRRSAVTAKLEVEYRRPALLHREMLLEAWTERIEGRKIHLAGEMRGPNGEMVATAAALFIGVNFEDFIASVSAEVGDTVSEESVRRWAETVWRGNGNSESGQDDGIALIPDPPVDPAVT